MAAWRNWASVAVVLAVVLPARAQNCALKETLKTGDCFQLQIDMNLSGDMHVVRDNQPASLKLAATARHVFAQRILDVDAKGVAQKAACAYEAAEASIQAGPSRSKRVLRPERTLLVVERAKEHSYIYCPKGALTREEMELTSEHFDTLALTGLLPGKEVAVAETWKITAETAQALCHFEGLTAQDLTGKLDEVKDGVALVSVTGTANGIDLGALVKLNIQAACRFDLKTQRLVAIEWKQKDDRAAGPASPASVTETTYTVQRRPVDAPESLNNVALVSVPQGGVPEEMLQLFYRDPKSRFELHYERDWQVTSQTEERTVLRLMERGDFVAQATINPWIKARAGEHLAPDDFQRAMASTPGWKQEQVLQAGPVMSSEKGRYVYRVSAVGQMDGLKLFQNFYLIANAAGEQVVVAFTMTQSQAEKLGTRDLTLVSNLDIPNK